MTINSPTSLQLLITQLINRYQREFHARSLSLSISLSLPLPGVNINSFLIFGSSCVRDYNARAIKPGRICK